MVASIVKLPRSALRFRQTRSCVQGTLGGVRQCEKEKLRGPHNTYPVAAYVAAVATVGIAYLVAAAA